MTSPPCPYCGSSEWSRSLGGDGLKPSGLVIAAYDEHGDPGLAHGVEVIAYSCRGCGYIRLFDPAFVPKNL